MEEDGAEYAPVPSAVFTVADLPARDRYEVWKNSIACIFDVDADKTTREEGFFASVHASMYGPLMLARTTTRGQRWERSPLTIARDGMDHYMIQVYERGGQALTGDGVEAEQPRGGLLVYDLSRTVQARTETFTNLSLIIPRALLSEALRMPDDQHMRALSAEEPMVALLRDHMASLKSLAERMTAAQSRAVVPATVALAAACLNASREGAAEGGADIAPALLIKARRLIDANLSNPDLSPDWLARRLGMSRAKLYRLFEPLGGVADVLRERRLRAAFMELADCASRGHPIYDIALRAGFSSETTFGRAFRRRYGVTPREVRRGAAPLLPRPANDRLDHRYEDWLQHLAT